MSDALKNAQGAHDYESGSFYASLAQAEAAERANELAERANALAEADLHLTMILSGMMMPGEAKLVGTAPQVHNEGTPEEHTHDVEVWEGDDAMIQIRINRHKERIAEILDLPKEKL